MWETRKADAPLVCSKCGNHIDCEQSYVVKQFSLFGSRFKDETFCVQCGEEARYSHDRMYERFLKVKSQERFKCEIEGCSHLICEQEDYYIYRFEPREGDTYGHEAKFGWREHRICIECGRERKQSPLPYSPVKSQSDAFAAVFTFMVVAVIVVVAILSRPRTTSPLNLREQQWAIEQDAADDRAERRWRGR